MLSQTVIDAIGAQPPTTTAKFNIKDCAGNNVSINPSSPTTLNASTGATTYADSAGKTQIDWTQAYSTTVGGPAGNTGNYMAVYVACTAITASTFETPMTYEIRWNIRNLSPVTKLVVVGARRNGGGVTAQNGSGNLRFFAPPTTLRAILGTTF